MASARTNGRQGIFRERALNRYLQNQQRIVFLRLTQPRLLRYVWVLLACLALLVVLAWRIRVPVVANGTGLVVAGDDLGARTGHRAGAPAAQRIVVLLSPDRLGQLKSEQRVVLRDAQGRPLLVGRVQEVEPALLSPSELRRRFALDAVQTASSQGPAAVAIVRIEARPGGLPAASYLGGSAPAEVETGTRQLLGLIPGLRFFVREPAS